jgi:adenylate kinase family enzyme
VLRGNSGSGKSTIARALHQRFDHGRSTLTAQDTIRRTILRAPGPGAIATAATDRSTERSGLIIHHHQI